MSQKTEAVRAIDNIIKDPNVEQGIKDYLQNTLVSFVPSDASVLSDWTTIKNQLATTAARRAAIDDLVALALA